MKEGRARGFRFGAGAETTCPPKWLIDVGCRVCLSDIVLFGTHQCPERGPSGLQEPAFSRRNENAARAVVCLRFRNCDVATWVWRYSDSPR